MASYFGAFWLFASVNLFGVLQYPYLFGGTASFLDYLNNTAISGDVTLVTFVGGALLIVTLIVFMYIDYMRKGPAGSY